MIAAAFDKDAFPSFGRNQPGTYGAIHRKLLRSHPEDASLALDEMQESLAKYLQQRRPGPSPSSSSAAATDLQVQALSGIVAEISSMRGAVEEQASSSRDRAVHSGRSGAEKGQVGSTGRGAR